MRTTCVNCKYGTRMGKVIRCEVRGIMKTKPFDGCGNHEPRPKEEVME